MTRRKSNFLQPPLENNKNASLLMQKQASASAQRQISMISQQEISQNLKKEFANLISTEDLMKME